MTTYLNTVQNGIATNEDFRLGSSKWLCINVVMLLHIKKFFKDTFCGKKNNVPYLFISVKLMSFYQISIK